ncbi:MAG: Eco57I restriction-modification methylase domain-containing protein [Methanophagales archaeon]|nr:Eco57I restriction-modification methylase domain-containing protein [Methanophagales archaeon]
MRKQKLEEEIERLKRTKQTSLAGKVAEREQKKLVDERKILEHKLNVVGRDIEDLRKVEQNLRDPEKKLFVWELDFAEIFGDKGGFDIVIGNPPYVRQEKISPPNRTKAEVTLEDRKTYKDKLIESVKMKFGVMDRIDKKSDYYVYFYFHGLSLLNEKGTFCFITSNSWLDVSFGKHLQEFLLKYVPIIAIYDNPKRSFEHASINTIIAVFGTPWVSEKTLSNFKAGSEEYPALKEVAKFVMFKKPFEEVLSAENLIAIENTEVKERNADLTELVENVVDTDDYRVFPVLQKDLLEDGWEYPAGYDRGRGKFKAGSYGGNKWGGKFLRAPEIFYTILRKGKGKLVRLGDIAEVRFGIKTGANEFFYVEDVTDKNPDLSRVENIRNLQTIEEIRDASLRIIKPSKFKRGDKDYRLFLVEEEFLITVLKSAKDSKTIVVSEDELSTKLFYCHEDRNGLKHTYAKDYIDWGERNGINKISSVRGRRRWWDVGVKSPMDAIILRRIGERMPFFESNGVLEDCCLFGIKRKSDAINKTVFLSILNSTWVRMHIELMTRQLTGAQAVADTNVYVVKEAWILKPEILDDNIVERIMRIYGTLRKKEALSIFEECGIDPSKPIREQEPNPLPDRAELDNIIFDELGLTAAERKEVYWSVCELVKQRLEKARSLRR